ncbi:MAG: glycine cleavage system aminomethyltransferase GcvT [Anaerolineaceae bacterium]|nr:glycine cleavage system aminomethyltransferase GcvT [Anaerolineaceae bacterium]
MSEFRRTVLHDKHVALGAKMVEFGGWEMPLHYRSGILQEHLATRKTCGLFDVSHMGRFIFRGPRALDFLQHVLASNAAALEAGQAQYTIIPNSRGGAVDDAYLYRFFEDQYLLVVNAANCRKDREHFDSILPEFAGLEMADRTEELAMISLQGPQSKQLLTGLIDSGNLPEPKRNALSVATIGGLRTLIARTGYTGEPLCFELFVQRRDAPTVWDRLAEQGACPVGLGARDTLRLEAGLPLYGHELGLDPEQKEIPVFACPLARFAVSFSPSKGDFVGRAVLGKQSEALKKILDRDYSLMADLPRIVRPVAVSGRAVARAGAKVFAAGGDKLVGYVTSGTVVPYWKSEGRGLDSRQSEDRGMRSICLALLDGNLQDGDRLAIDIRGRQAEAAVVPYHLRSEAPPFSRPIVHDAGAETPPEEPAAETSGKVRHLLDRAAANTLWRQTECINLIPSEQTASPMVRLLSVMDPAFRYAEHKAVKAFDDAEVFYYQGTDFIREVERLLEVELCRFLGAGEVETRPVSGQMANAVVFSALTDYLNRTDRKSEPRRIRKVINNDIFKGGHLSSQPMGALRDYLARDPQTERPAVVNFPVLPDNPYMIDVEACGPLIARHKPELIIFGKSLVLHPEPVAQVRALVDALGIKCLIMYDMAHVLGLVGPHFQQPFAEGADLVTGSTHKTFFGTQRGIVAGGYEPGDPDYELWETIRRRTFPGAVSNHHLGTLLGLLMAAYEMNHFKDHYQKAVLSNARAFARALKDCGVDVAGQADLSYTETHQVLVSVGYGKGPEMARRLEESNIIVNYQAGPDEEGFSASGLLRMGVAEMTRFGMKEADFQALAQLVGDVLVGRRSVLEEVRSLRKRFVDLKFCFTGKQYDEMLQKLHGLI